MAKEAFDLVIEFNKLNPKIGAKKRMVMQPNLDSALKSVHVLQVDASVYMEEFVYFGRIIKNHALETVLTASQKETISVTL